MRSKTTRKYLEDIAKELNITVAQAQEIAEAPFQFVAKVFKEGDRTAMNFNSVRIMYFGRFMVKKGRVEHFKKINDRH